MLTRLISVAAHPVPGAGEEEGGKGGNLPPELNSSHYLAYLAHPSRPLNQIYSPLKWSSVCQWRRNIAVTKNCIENIPFLPPLN